MDQQSLGVVVGVVGRGELAGGRRKQEVIAQGPGGLLQALPGLRRPAGGVAPAQGEGNLPVRAEDPAEFRVPVRLGAPDAVMEVGRPEGDPQPERQRPQHPEQGHGIRPAGEGDGHVVAGEKQGVILYIV